MNYRYPICLLFNFGFEDARDETVYVDAESAILASAMAREIAEGRRSESRVVIQWRVLPTTGPTR